MDDNHLLITKEELEEFKKAVLKEYGVKLTDQQVYELGSVLPRLIDHFIEKRFDLKRKEIKTDKYNCFSNV